MLHVIRLDLKEMNLLYLYYLNKFKKQKRTITDMKYSLKKNYLY